MPLFQKSVITKYLKAQNKELILSKWKSYSDHFLNPRVQEEIKSLKEEQYQKFQRTIQRKFELEELPKKTTRLV